jgi:hypothetical protein
VTDSASGCDLVVVSISSVQRFIAESRTTSDLRSASEIISRLAEEAAVVCGRVNGARVVFPGAEAGGPAGEAVGAPNRVVALVPAGAGPSVARDAADAVRALWAGWVRQLFGREIATTGMPSVQWVCAPAALGDYAAQWAKAQAGLVARRRVRDFWLEPVFERRLCSLSPRWPAEEQPPGGTPEFQRDTLSAAGWVKRRWRSLAGDGNRPGFPSTSSVASALFRQRVLERLGEPPVRAAVERLRAAVTLLDVPAEAPIRGLAGVGGPLGSGFVAARGRGCSRRVGTPTRCDESWRSGCRRSSTSTG